MNIFEIIIFGAGIIFCVALVWYANRPLYIALECRACKFRNEHGIGWKEDGSEVACEYCEGSGVIIYKSCLGQDQAKRIFDNLLWCTYKKPKGVKLSEISK